MAESSHDSVSYPPLSLGPDFDDPLQSDPQSDFHESPSLQQPSTESHGRFTPQFDWPFAEDLQGLPLSGLEVAQMSQSLAAPTQTQSSFIRLTSLLKDSFLETPTPSPSSRLGLAACTGLDLFDVSAWFDIIRSLTIDVRAKSCNMSNITQASVSEIFPNLNPPRNSARPIRPLRTSATSRQRRSSTDHSGPSKRRQNEDASQDKGSLRGLDSQQKISQQRPSKNSMEGPYCCPTTACKFSTMNFDQWHTHQSRKHFPSEIFVCGINSCTKLCNKGPNNPCKRKDNFVTHLKDSHDYESGTALDQEVSKRTVKVTGLFHDKCGFCSETLETREASIEHIGDHIKSGHKITDWTHRCTSLEHTLQHHVHFEISLDRPATDDNSSENFDQLIQLDDYDHGDGGNLIDQELNSDTREDCASIYACAAPSRRSAGYSPHTCVLPLRTSTRHRVLSSRTSAKNTSDNPDAYAITSGRYTGHSLARLNEQAGPLPSFTATGSSSAQYTLREESFLYTWYEDENMSRQPKWDRLSRWEGQSNYSTPRDWTMGTKLFDRYGQGSFRGEPTEPNSSHLGSRWCDEWNYWIK